MSISARTAQRKSTLWEYAEKSESICKSALSFPLSLLVKLIILWKSKTIIISTSSAVTLLQSVMTMELKSCI